MHHRSRKDAGPPQGRVRCALALAGAAFLVGPLVSAVLAQDAPPPQRTTPNLNTPDLADPVLKLLDAPYLTDDERRNLRVFHGVWREDDLATPQRRATAALIRGIYDDPSFDDPAVLIEDRAEARLRRGDLDECLSLLADHDSIRAMRLRAQALETLGKPEEASKALDPLLAKLNKGDVSTAADMTELVRALLIRARVAPQTQPAGGDFQRMNALLAQARDKLGRLYWPAYLTEAELLDSKDNTQQGVEAVAEALALCPGSADAWRLLGMMHADGFNFDAVEKCAEKLDAIAGGPSPGAALILARARMRENDPDGAAKLIEPMLARYPKMRPLLATSAAIAALRYDFQATDALLARFDALSPGSPDALFEVGRTLSEARQYEPAAKYLSLAAKRAPFRAEPVAELGLLGLQSGKDFDAIDALRKATALDPFNTRVENTLKLALELQKYERVESDHFIVRYRTGEDGVLAHEMPAQLERMYKRVTGKGKGGIDHEPVGKTTIDLMPDQRWFAVRIAGITRIHTMAASTGPTIAMETPREGAGHSVGAYDWLRVVRHEFTHTVTLSRTKNRIPHWFTEAAAVYLEDAPRDYRTCKLLQDALENDGLFDFSEINLGFIRPRKPTDRPLAYAQGHWMYQYMIERWSERAPLELMDRYAAGLREDAAMREVLGMSQEEFLEAFKGWAREQLVSWGMTPPQGEPSVADILLSEATNTDKGRAAAQAKLDAAADGIAWTSASAGGPKQTWDLDLPAPDNAMLQRWLEKYPDHPDLLEASVAKAVKAAGGKPTREMIPLIERYAAARSVDPLPHQLLATLALAAPANSDEGGPAAAIPHLEYLDAREQNSPSYAVALARQYAAQGDWTRADAKALRAITISPYSAEYRELAATIALQHSDYAAAAHQIEALTVLEPDREIHRKRLEAVRKKMNAQ